MATTAYPFDSQSTTETQYSYLMRELQNVGVVATLAYGGTDCQVVATGTAFQSKVNAGRAFIRGFMYDSTDAPTFTHGSVAAGSTRIDTIVLEVDPSANTITAKIVKGTGVTGTPVAPTLTQTDTGVYDMPLADVLVTNTGTLTVTDRRAFLGTGTGVWTTANRPVSPRKYTLGFNEDLADWEFWNGTAWISFASLYNPAATDTGWQSSPIGSTSPHSVGGEVRKIGIQVWCSLAVTLGADITAGNTGNQKIGTISSAYRPGPTYIPPLTSTSFGPVVTGYVDTDGSLMIAATGSAAASGSTLTLSGSWLTT